MTGVPAPGGAPPEELPDHLHGSLVHEARPQPPGPLQGQGEHLPGEPSPGGILQAPAASLGKVGLGRRVQEGVDPLQGLVVVEDPRQEEWIAAVRRIVRRPAEP